MTDKEIQEAEADCCQLMMRATQHLDTANKYIASEPQNNSLFHMSIALFSMMSVIDTRLLLLTEQLMRIVSARSENEK